jgi:hypothetical protein
MNQCKRWEFQPEYLFDLQRLCTQEHLDFFFSGVQYIILQKIYKQGLSNRTYP